MGLAACSGIVVASTIAAATATAGTAEYWSAAALWEQEYDQKDKNDRAAVVVHN